MSTKAPDISFPAILTVRCRGEVLASGGISLNSSSVKVMAGNEAPGAKAEIDVLNSSGVMPTGTYKSVIASSNCC